MFYFVIAPEKYRKIFFFQRSIRHNSEETLGAYYLRTHYHLIPEDVEFWECDIDTKEVTILPATISHREPS